MTQKDISTVDHTLITELYQRYATTLLKYIYASTHRREDAEDVLVEVFLAAFKYKGLSQLNEKQQYAWLISVARNKTIDWYRYSNRHVQTSLEFIFAEDMYDTDERLPEHAMIKKEEYALLQERISRLPELQQEVVRLRFIAGLRSVEIARMIGKTEGAIQAALWRALRALRTLYQNEKDRGNSGEF
ncbi:RNA polymerase sigma factor [Ktedonobacteria bacterium brp13]|jgi:RNA polymerase sigma-70 factor, ECF subfamily|nr:RNA polymerase sigma factor [Ktedonobacteria bacterium brp13]